MSVLVEAGRASLAKGVLNQPIYLAWGTGDASWDEYVDDGKGGTKLTCSKAPAPSVTATGLTHEIGRKVLLRGLFVKEDPNGELEASNGKRYKASDTPTATLFLEFRFDYGDGDDETIREVGVFVGCIPKDTCPVGKTYFTPDEFENPGILLTLAHLDAPSSASPQLRTSFNIIVKV